ncbi:MAG: 6-pyruvoyl-tetrahydropterin synthase-related protein [Acidimicrobiales bacterium]
MHRPTAPVVATAIAVVGAVGIVLWQLDPALLLANTTTAGGDTGAHVAVAAFLRTQLLPHWHLTGWDPGWFAGFPIYTFYFPLPDLLAALVGYLIPFNVAFKLATVAGMVSLPVAAWLFGRMAGLERPIPAVLAVATLPFLFDQTFTIYGGNIYSTLAGEYAFSFGLSLALVFLGLAMQGMRTGRYRALAALVLCAVVLSHIVAMAFALVGGLVVLLLAGVTRKRLWWMVSTIGTAGLLASWWGIPFAAFQAYTTDMGWVNVTSYLASLAPVADRWALVLAAVGAVVALARRSRGMLVMAILGAVSAVAFVADPQGKLYNARFLPLWILCVYLLAGYAVAEVATIVARWWRHAGVEPGSRDVASHRWAPGAVVVPLAALGAACIVVLPPLLLPAGSPGVTLGPVHVKPSAVPSWVAWNYSGYQRKTGWPEYHAVVATMQRVAGQYGCGRAMWEYSPNLNRFGTPMALMLLPYWTDGCVASMEGLLFESSATTPYHFINQAELSAQPSEAMVGLPYGSLDIPLGVAHLQMLGVRYFMASSPLVEQQASLDSQLTLVASTGPWHTAYEGREVTTTWDVYLVHGSAEVAPLAEQPAVLTGVGQAQPSWMPVALKWYDDPADWSTDLVAGGPSSWQRIDPGASARAVPLPKVRVSRIRVTQSTISFRVDRIGVPVVVRTSYFPAWHAHGAHGPWRAVPNLMVVVPTRHDVTLSYGSTAPGMLGTALSVLGVVALMALVYQAKRSS